MNYDDDQGRQGLFAVMWDCNGLEAVVPVPDAAEHTFAALAGRKPPQMPPLMHWRLRAQANSQRNYEIYIVTADAGITADDIRSMFDANPQMAADTIRSIGQQFYSDRLTRRPVIV